MMEYKFIKNFLIKLFKYIYLKLMLKIFMIINNTELFYNFRINAHTDF